MELLLVFSNSNSHSFYWNLRVKEKSPKTAFNSVFPAYQHHQLNLGDALPSANPLLPFVRPTNHSSLSLPTNKTPQMNMYGTDFFAQNARTRKVSTQNKAKNGHLDGSCGEQETRRRRGIRMVAPGYHRAVAPETKTTAMVVPTVIRGGSK